MAKGVPSALMGTSLIVAVEKHQVASEREKV